MGVKDRYNEKRKKKEDESQNETSSFGGVKDRYELNKSIGTSSHDVNEDFINTFISDANNFITSAEKEYGNIGWGNASSIYDTTNNSWKDLYARSNSIRRWLDSNKDKFDEETYNSFSSSLDDYKKNAYSVLSSFSNAKDFYSQFDSEDDYNAWKKRNEEEQSIIGLEDYDEFSQKGASIENPTMKEAEGWLTIGEWRPFGDDIGNIVTYSRENANELRLGALNGSRLLGDFRYAHMTDNEVGIYNYYLAKYGEEKASEYLKSIDDELDKREAGVTAEAFDDNVFLEALLGFTAGVETSVQGLKGLADFVTGNDSGTDFSATQYADQIVASNNTEVLKGVHDVSSAIGGMTPSILVGTVTGGLGGALTMGASAVGNGYNEMKKLGYNDWQARGYGLLVGASEATLQYALGGISKLGGKVTGNAVKNLVSKFDNVIARTAIQLGGNMASEGLEEAIQAVLEPAFKALMTGEEFEAPEWEEVWYSALLGALTAGVLEGVPTIAGTAIDSYQANKVYGSDPQALVTEALEIDPDNAHAQRMQARLDGGKNVSGYHLNRLVNANEQSLLNQDKVKMKSAVEARLTELGETGDIGKLANVIVKAQSGGKLTLSERSLLVKSKHGRRVSTELNPKSIESGAYTSEWAETIGTERINTEAYNKGLYDPVAEEELTPVGEEGIPSTENPTQKDNATEAKFEVSTDGKTKVGDTEVSIKEIASVKDGEVILLLEDGSTVNASDVEYGSSEEGLLYENVVHMNLNAATANAFVKGYDPSMSVEQYALGFREAYRYGEYGFPVQEMSTEGFSAMLSESQKSLAYNLGKTDAKYKVEKKQSEKAKIASISAINVGKDSQKTSKKGKLHNTIAPTTERQKASLKALGVLADALGVDIYTYESKVVNGKRQGANGWFDPKDGSIHIDIHAGVNGEGTMLFTAAHELTHFIREWSPAKFKVFADFLLEQYGKKGASVDALVHEQIAKANRNGRTIDYDTAYEEVIADSCEAMLADGDVIAKIAELKAKDKTLWEKIKDFLTNLVARIREAYKGMTPDSVEAGHVAKMLDSAERLKALWTEALVDASEAHDASDLVEIDTETESVSPTMLSERTWTESDYVIHRDQMAEKIAKALDVSVKKAKSYIDDINSIAKMIANDRVRLDYEASSFGSAFVSNVEYGGSFDYTTLCKKRRIYTGTFTEIQKRLKDVALTPNDILKIRNLLIEEGIEATCGLCYVEGSRANMGKFAKEFIRLYKRDNPDAWIPNMADVNTPDGVEQMRINHPEAYEQYEYFWNHYGKLKDGDPALFASQQKPKLYEARKEYKGEILKHFKGDTTVAKKNLNGGIRMQSFSDFEIVHLIDTMQVIMDMSTVGLAGQAYTKVPEFAKAFGNTGLKINLSLIAKGVDENGNLILDDREGMPHNTAFELREKYSKNVGTIIVTFTDEQLLAAMADPRIDFIIPFHRSQWKKGQYGAMGLPKGTKDYTYMQNEKLIKQTYHEYRGRMVKDKASNYMPNEYWDFSKSGKENAEAYLKMCAENNKRPKFYRLLDHDGKGTYSLKADGSTDGYWKLLIDFKMYDNDGVGSPQMAVTPTFNMDEAKTMLDEYKCGHNKYPVANSVVDKFVDSYNEDHGTKYSDRDSLGNELSKEQQEYFKDSKIRDKKGNLMVLYHGTTANFNTFKKGDVGFHFGTKGAARGRVGFGKNVNIKEVYLNITNPIVFDEDLGSWDADWRLTRELYDMGILTQAEAESVLFTDDRQYKRTTDAANKKLALVLLEKGYDGIAYSNTFETKKATTSYIVFNSNQAKEITNKTPTSNPDIRYSDRDAVDLTDDTDLSKLVEDVFGASRYKTIAKYIMDVLGNEPIVLSDGRNAIVDKRDALHIANKANKAKTSQIAKLKEIIERAKLYAEDENADHNKFSQFLYYEAVVKYRNEQYPLYINVGLTKNDKTYHIYDITKKIRDTANRINGLERPTIDEGNALKSDISVNSIPQDFESVKSKFSDVDETPKNSSDTLDIRYSDRYSYENLISKPDMKLTTVGVTAPANRADVVYQAKKNAASIGHTDKHGGVFVHVADTNADVLLGTDGLKHGLRRTKNPQNDINYIVALKAGEILQNSICVNELIPSKHEAKGSYVLIGAAKNPHGDFYIVRSVINRFSNELASMDVLYAINTKKESAALNAPRFTAKPLSVTDSTISIAHLLDYVNRYFPDILPESVLRHYGHEERPNGELGKDALYSARDPDSFSNRSLLVNALESVTQNDIERKKLAEYKSKIALIESEQSKLSEIRAKIKDLSFAKGARDTEAIKKLQFEENQTANRINTYDKQLLNLESTKALKGVLEREKKLAYKRAEQRGKDALEAYRERATKTQRELMDRYQESRKKGVESRNKTAMRHKIKDVVTDLNQYLLNGTKDKHVPIQLQKAVAEALDAVNMDTVGAEERIAKKRAEMMRAKTPEAIERLAKEIEHIQEMGGNMASKISRLKTSYDSIINSDDPLIANSYDDVIANTIDKVIEVVGDTPLRDMSLYQLEAVYDMYRMVLHSIRTANKAFKAEKGKEISVLANTVIADLDGKKKNPLNLADTSFAWNNLKPVYAFERIGSNTLTKLFNAVREGEDVWARDMSEAQAFREEQSKKYKFDSWDFEKKYTFNTHRGTPFELDLGEMMSIYAFAKDEHSKGHLIGEGFVFDPKKEVVENVKGKIKVKVNLEDATSYNLSEEIVADIISKIPQDARDFADAMQDYLSTTMGEKGNEVSLELYEIKLFKNKNYFPLKVAPQYMAVAKEKAQGDVKIKNKGFTKDRKEGAQNPIVLSSFMDVWASHVNEMSMYHAFTLPLEDFYRVFNYKTPRMEGYAPMSVNASIETAYGRGATQYIDQLLKDLNGGARVDPTAGIINKLTGLFKKSAVFASLSVVVQQPSAIARATALVDSKYFVGKKVTKAKHKETWAEVKKYAPVAIIKEMGYFDTGMGQSSVQWLKGDKTWKDKLDDIASKAPALADELSWCAIWNAVKRETLHTHKDLKPNSEEFLKAVGERFTEVVTKTQVYDSVLARSANMRSKDTGMKMATAFMGEPTTSINMLQDALTQGKRGNKRYARKAIGGVISSMILNSILVSLVYAGRDDDEDKSYAEKYVGTLTEELIDSVNPLTLIPFVKDIVSIAQGYDVERSDMSVITDIINAWNNLGSDNRSVYRKVEDFAGAIASIFGLPVKNIMRDARGIYNTVNSFINGEQTTGAGLKDSIVEAVTGDEKSNGQQLYEAILSGDTEQIERVKGRFEDQKDINSAIRNALRDNDPRIKQAAEARYNGNISEYMRIAKEIIAEGNFKQDDIVSAINSEISALKKGDGTSESSASSNKVTSIYKVDDYYAALVGRDQATAYVVKEDLIKTSIANGKDREEAEADFNSSFASHIRDMYEAGELTDYEARNMLINYGGKTYEDASAKVQYWEFKKKYPDYDLSEEAVKKYYNEVEPSGINVGVYNDYCKQRSKCKGTDANADGKTDSGSVKYQVMAVIDSLPITNRQKDVLYYLNGWSASTIWEAPWH